MDSELQTIRCLAETASVHAREQLGQPLSVDDFEAFLQILDQLRSAAPTQISPHEIQSLALVYGAWLGQWLCSTVGGRWVGLAEPVAPRVQAGGLIVSPIDAVRRTLSGTCDPSLAELIDEIQTHSVPVASVTQSNREAWDRLASDAQFTNPDAFPDSPEQAAASLDPWLAQFGIADRDVLCLAAGGGTHGVLLAIAGARVTIVDISPKQLAIDEALAMKAGVSIRTHLSSMDDLSAFDSESFDAVVQPVSTCYLAELTTLFREVARVLRPGGLYVSQHKQSAALRATLTSQGIRIADREHTGKPVQTSDSLNVLHEPGTIEFAHSLETILGGICHHRFVIEDVVEPIRSDAWAHWKTTPEEAAAYQAHFLAPYLKVKARRR